MARATRRRGEAFRRRTDRRPGLERDRRLLGAYLFADADTLKLLDDMAKMYDNIKDGTIEEFEDRASPSRLGKTHLSPQEPAAFTRLSLDEFVKANILKLGISVECPNCMKKNWCSLHSLDEQVTCERCLKDFSFPQGSLNFRNTPWQYRVVGPFSVPNFAAGAYATVLALRLFSQNLGSHAQLTYSTNLDITMGQDKLKEEIDFTFWYLRISSLIRTKSLFLCLVRPRVSQRNRSSRKTFREWRVLATAFPGVFRFCNFEGCFVGRRNVHNRKVGFVGTRAIGKRSATRSCHRPHWNGVVFRLACYQAWKDCGDKRGQFAAASYFSWTISGRSLTSLSKSTSAFLTEYAELRQRVTTRPENQ